MSSHPVIEARNVKKTFGDIKAVDDISFEVEAGEIFAFLGPNGAGKSTTISMLTTMLRPTSGKLFLNGHDVTKEQDSARKSFGIVFQDPALEEELTAYENMAIHAVLYSIPRKDQAARIEDLLKLVDLWGRKDGYVKTYSGGMRRRLADRIAIIDHGKIIATGTSKQLAKQTGTKNLEDAYLELTGRTVRDETSLANNGLNVRTAMRNRNIR
jgi:ABC-2 type transport system ATP-binding protein